MVSGDRVLTSGPVPRILCYWLRDHGSDALLEAECN